MTDEGLTAGQAARRLGVAVTTLRSWHRRYGLGPTRHVHGRHRRYGGEDLARLETMRTLTAQGMPAAEAARMAAAGVLVPAAPAGPAATHLAAAGDAAEGDRRAVRGLIDTAMRLDDDRARQLISRSFAAHGVVHTWDNLVCPAMHRIGDRHAVSGELVEVEHLLSRVVSESLAAVRASAPDGPVQSLLACADEEQHTLPLEALAAAAAEHQVPSRLLGARVPPAALRAAVRRTGPSLVVVWSHAAGTGDPDQLRLWHGNGGRAPLLAAAGPGWRDGLPDGVVAPTSLTEALQLLVAVAQAGWHAG